MFPQAPRFTTPKETPGPADYNTVRTFKSTKSSKPFGSGSPRFSPEKEAPKVSPRKSPQKSPRHRPTNKTPPNTVIKSKDLSKIDSSSSDFEVAELKLKVRDLKLSESALIQNLSNAERNHEKVIAEYKQKIKELEERVQRKIEQNARQISILQLEFTGKEKDLKEQIRTLECKNKPTGDIKTLKDLQELTDKHDRLLSEMDSLEFKIADLQNALKESECEKKALNEELRERGDELKAESEKVLRLLTEAAEVKNKLAEITAKNVEINEGRNLFRLKFEKQISDLSYDFKKKLDQQREEFKSLATEKERQIAELEGIIKGHKDNEVSQVVIDEMNEVMKERDGLQMEVKKLNKRLNEYKQATIKKHAENIQTMQDRITEVQVLVNVLQHQLEKSKEQSNSTQLKLQEELRSKDNTIKNLLLDRQQLEASFAKQLAALELELHNEQRRQIPLDFEEKEQMLHDELEYVKRLKSKLQTVCKKYNIDESTGDMAIHGIRYFEAIKEENKKLKNELIQVTNERNQLKAFGVLKSE